MRSAPVAAVLLAAFSFAIGAATTPAKKGVASKKTTKSGKKAVSARKPAGRAVASASSKAKAASSKKGKTGKKVPVATWRNRQQNPTPERYKEIQQALVSRGYLKSEPDGVWNADSVNALQRFQADQKLTATGKINAPSLIGLGLGAPSAGAPVATPPPQ